jgi:hypothetical protein
MARDAPIIAHNERHVNRGAEATKDCFRRDFMLYWIGRTELGGIGMDGGGGAGRQGLLKLRTVQGEPYYANGRRLVPVVRIVSFGKARATIGNGRSGGLAVGFVWMKPLAVLEAGPEGEHRVPITDATASAVYGMLGLALAITLVSVAVRWLGGRLRGTVPMA